MPREADALANFSWVHTCNSRMRLTVSPFYHCNRANYHSALTDPLVTPQRRGSTYAGGQASFSANTTSNDFQAGVYRFYQRNNELLGARASTTVAATRRSPTWSIPPAAWRRSCSMTN
jgi:hypothetical protein